ncbi:hypothetical protein DFQ26_002974 [Actinomortierella ambigua]|nr:hypothetical protein DFQ26_002974 [Actinomortierella ambigua]
MAFLLKKKAKDLEAKQSDGAAFGDVSEDLIRSSYKPTNMDHLKTLIIHNARLTSRSPVVFIFGAVIPLMMIGIAIAISLSIQSNIPEITAGMVDTRAIDIRETGIKDEYVSNPVVYVPIIQAVPELSALSSIVAGRLQSVLTSFNPVLKDYPSMDAVALYEHDVGEKMLKNRTMRDYLPQLGFELDSLKPSPSGGSVDFGYTIAFAQNDSMAFMLTTLDRLTQNVDPQTKTIGNASTINFMPTLKTFGARREENSDIASFIVPAFLTYAFSFFITFVASTLVYEKEKGQKNHLQSMGIKPGTYYMARFVIDLVCYLIPVVMVFILMGSLGLKMITSGSWVPYLLLLLLSGPSFISMGYLLSIFFNDSQTVGQVLGIGLSVVVFVPYFMVQFVFGGANLLAIVLVGIFIPSFALERSISAVAMAQTTGVAYTIKDTFDITRPVFPTMIVFVVQTCLYLALLFWAESQIQARRSFKDVILGRRSSDESKAAKLKSEQDAATDPCLRRQDTSVFLDGKYREQDAEVLEETIRLRAKGMSGSDDNDDNDAVRLLGLSKTFQLKGKRDLVILDNVYLSFKKNECFGYLGPNGAGKTTSIKILTGALSPTAGNATIYGRTVVPFHDELRSMIGICPQFDVLWPDLTSREHLWLFARIKGVAPEQVNDAVEQMVREMDLGPLGDKKAKTFSGGNKRRLSLAMAVIGAPKIVFLDEPTTGVDVAIRQAIWNSIRKLKRHSCVILTTHSMEEADALCDRIGIITNGHIQALGTSQRLKNTYGAGYKIIVKTHNSSAENANAVTRALEDTVGAGRVTLVQALGTTLEYELARVEGERTTDMLAKMFRVFEQHRQELGIADYSVSQTTLAQVFIEFAKEQAAPEEK